MFYCDPGSRGVIKMEFSKGTASFRSIFVMNYSICRKIVTEKCFFIADCLFGSIIIILGVGGGALYRKFKLKV